MNAKHQRDEMDDIDEMAIVDAIYEAVKAFLIDSLFNILAIFGLCLIANWLYRLFFM